MSSTRPGVPEGVRVYAVGDIHGRLDLLRQLHRSIEEDAQGHLPARNIAVYLGDYIDRGPDSRGVVEFLIAEPLPVFECHHLCGNHDAWLLKFLDGIDSGVDWMFNGGDVTLESYGVELGAFGLGGDLENTRRELAARLPDHHAAFFRGLALSHVVGDYLFVHAGIRPGVPIDAQDPDDLMWIREEFLGSVADHGKIVVHGHTPDHQVQVKENRIGIDTAAYATGRLTCLVLEGDGRRFLHT
jgi:serine/threonine protein phosphatase 1